MTPGDIVFNVRQHRQNKVTPNFNPSPLCVTRVQGSLVTAQFITCRDCINVNECAHGKYITRDISFFKLFKKGDDVFKKRGASNGFEASMAGQNFGQQRNAEYKQWPLLSFMPMNNDNNNEHNTAQENINVRDANLYNDAADRQDNQTIQGNVEQRDMLSPQQVVLRGNPVHSCGTPDRWVYQ